MVSLRVYMHIKNTFHVLVKRSYTTIKAADSESNPNKKAGFAAPLFTPFVFHIAYAVGRIQPYYGNIHILIGLAIWYGVHEHGDIKRLGLIRKHLRVSVEMYAHKPIPYCLSWIPYRPNNHGYSAETDLMKGLISGTLTFLSPCADLFSETAQTVSALSSNML